jgi:YbbR domain-containing protein
LLGLRTSGSDFRKSGKKLLRKLHSRGVLTALIFAFSLWLYVSMNNDYSIFITVPLEIRTNEDQAIENSLPTSLTVQIRGKGWDLFNAKYLSSSRLCLLDISKYDLGTDVIDFPYTKLTKNLLSMEQFEVKSISPENLTIILGKVTKGYKPIKSNITVIPRLGFTLVGKVGLEPNEVLVKGFASKLDSLDSIPTSNLTLNDAYFNTSGIISVNDSLFPIFRIHPTQLRYTTNIQFKCDVAFRQIPVRVRGGVLSAGNVLQPKYLTVYITGGVDELTNVLPSDISAYIDYDKLISDSTGNLVPEINLPKNVSLLKIEPAYIYHYKYKNASLR